MSVAMLLVSAFDTAAQEPDLADQLRIVQQAEAQRIETFDGAAKSVVCIFADRSRAGGGSGVIISEDGYGLTNFHVVAIMLETRQGFGGLSDGRLYPLQVLGIDPGGDVAMFKLSGRDRFDAAPLGDSDAVRVGDWAAAMGNPFTLAEDYTPTITYGIISGVHRYQYGQGNALEYADCIQASTSINPGNSGGPLFNMAGEIIGINGRGSFEERGRVNVGLGYAIGANQIKRFIPWLRAGQTAEHGTLGATVAMAGDDLIFEAIQDFSPIGRHPPGRCAGLDQRPPDAHAERVPESADDPAGGLAGDGDGPTRRSAGDGNDADRANPRAAAKTACAGLSAQSRRDSPADRTLPPARPVDVG
jgi:S1-C subfamily serine protease